MLNPNVDELKDPIDLDPTDQAFIDNESQDSDIDMNTGTQDNEDHTNQSTGNTGHTGSTDESEQGTAANSGDNSQPPNNNEPPSQSQTPEDTDNKDSAELHDSDLEDEYPNDPKITPLSMDPDKIMTERFNSHTPILTNDLTARPSDPRLYYKSFDTNNIKH